MTYVKAALRSSCRESEESHGIPITKYNFFLLKPVSVLGVSEMRWEGQGEIRSGDYTVYYSGGERAERGVAIAVHRSILRSVVKKIVYNDGIIALKLKTEPVSILIMQVYMPTSEYENYEVEKLCDTTEEILEEDGKGDTNNII